MIETAALLMIQIYPWLLPYLLFGLPGLWMSVRMSLDVVDFTNKDLLCLAYLFWPVMLSITILERGWDITKKLAWASYSVMKFLTEKFENVLQGIASHAETSKRKALKATKAKRFKMLEDIMAKQEIMKGLEQQYTTWVCNSDTCEEFDPEIIEITEISDTL